MTRRRGTQYFLLEIVCFETVKKFFQKLSINIEGMGQGILDIWKGFGQKLARSGSAGSCPDKRIIGLQNRCGSFTFKIHQRFGLQDNH